MQKGVGGARKTDAHDWSVAREKTEAKLSRGIEETGSLAAWPYSSKAPPSRLGTGKPTSGQKSYPII